MTHILTPEPIHPSNMTPAELHQVTGVERRKLPEPYNHTMSKYIPDEHLTPALREEAKRDITGLNRYIAANEGGEEFRARLDEAEQVSQQVLTNDPDLAEQLAKSRKSRQKAQNLGQKAVGISKVVNESQGDDNESSRLVSHGLSDRLIAVKPGVNGGNTASTSGEYNSDGEKVTTRRTVYRGTVQVERVDKETGETVYSKLVPDPTLAAKVNSKIARVVSDAAKQDITEAVQPLIEAPEETQKPA